jgi:recombination protein RecA
LSKSELKKTVDQILKDYHTGLIFGALSTVPEHKPLSSGFPGLDAAICNGNPGLPPGRIIELFGPERAGKTTLSIAVLAEGQRRGEEVAYIDVEHRVDLPYMQALGLKLEDNFVYVRPDTGEMAFDIVRRLLRSGVKRVAIDSLAALVAAAEEANEGGPAAQNRLGLQAAMLSQSCRVLTPVLSKSGGIIIFNNQLRDNIGGYGAAEKTTGGRAVRHYASTRIRISRTGGNEPWGHMVKCYIVKNPVSAPFTEWIGRLVYGSGFDRIFDILKISVDIGLIEKKGNWYHHKGTTLGCGLQQVRDNLEEDKEVFDMIMKDINDWHGGK